MTTRRDRERMIAEGITTVDAELAAVENKLAQAIRERDEARQSYCSLMEAYRGGDGKATAEKMGWQYLFKEDSK